MSLLTLTDIDIVQDSGIYGQHFALVVHAIECV